MIFEEELMPLIRECLAEGKTVCNVPFRGISMLPMLRQGKDTVNLSPLPFRLKKYDLPVYQRLSGQYVMHRVVEVKETHYVCLGDNTTDFEEIKPEQMIAVVSSFTRDGKRISTDAMPYQIYCRLWRKTRLIRKGIRRGKNWLRRKLKL